MKSYLSLIPISAKVHRRQNRMTLLCIILAVFLVSTIFSMADMELRSQKIRAIQNNGNWHLAIQNISREDADIIARRPDVAASSWYDVMNYRLKEDYSLNGSKVAICGVEDKLVTDIMNNLEEGEFPYEKNQVLLTQNAKDILGVDIGSTVTLTIPSGEAMTFTVSGFGMDTVLTSKVDAVAVFMSLETYRELFSAVNDTAMTDADMTYYVQFRENCNMRRSIDNIIEEFHLSKDDVGENTALLGVLGYSSDSYMTGLYAAAVVLFLFVLAAGVLMIASSLNSSVARRTEFFGMLRCLGAEPRQIMRFVRLEALYWCKTAIPAGVVLGLAVTWILCAMLRFLSPGMFAELPVFGVSATGIAAGAVTGILTVFLAAGSPAKKASRVSPLTAVSGNAARQPKIRRAANTRFLKIHTALGFHHARQNKKNLLLMTGSFAISIVLFLGFSVFVTFMHHALNPLQPYTPDLSVAAADNSCTISRNLAEEIQHMDGVARVYGRGFADIPAEYHGKNVTITLISYEANQFGWAEQKGWTAGGQSLQKVTGEENSQKVAGKESRQNVTGNGNYVLAGYNAARPLKAGDQIVTSAGTLTVADTLYQCPFDLAGSDWILICSEDTFTAITGKNTYTIIDIQLTSDATDSDVNAIRQFSKDSLGDQLAFSDQRLSNRETAGAFYSFALFVYGFLAIIAMIAAFNIINSISMSVSARIKQYGAMRAVGIEIRQLIGMIGAETSVYAISGILCGSLIGLPLHYYLWQMLIYDRWNESWQFPLEAYAVILLVTVLSCAAAVFGPAKRIRETSIVEVISHQ